MEGMTCEGQMPVDNGPAPSPTTSLSSSLAIFMTRLIADKSNFNASGELWINATMIELIQVLIRAEQDRAEADKRRDDQSRAMANQMQAMASQINSLIQMNGQSRSLANPPAFPPPSIPRPLTYAERTRAHPSAVPRKPTTMPPTKDGIKMYRPGRAIIHSNPLNDQIDKIPRTLFVQRANEALASMNARVQDELVTVTGAHVMNSGDVVLYTKNKFHQKWLMDNKHLWSKQVHPDLEATPSAWSVLAHGVPKEFDPTSDYNKTNIATANGFKKEELIRMRWLSDNMKTAKQAGSIVLSFASKELADCITYKGIFIDYNYHQTTTFKPYPAQCFKCLKMGHFGKWCREQARCGRCNGNHMTRECPSCPENNAEITECVKCKEGLHNKVEGIEDSHHSVFSVLRPYKRAWLQAKNSRSRPLSS